MSPRAKRRLLYTSYHTLKLDFNIYSQKKLPLLNLFKYACTERPKGVHFFNVISIFECIKNDTIYFFTSIQYPGGAKLNGVYKPKLIRRVQSELQRSHFRK